MQTILSFILAVIVALTSSDALAGARDTVQQVLSENAAASPAAAQEASPAPETDATAQPAATVLPETFRSGWDTDWADMEYVHYDPAEVLARAEKLAALADGRDEQAVLALYDQLYEDMARIDTYSSIAYIRSSADVKDEYWSEESVYTDTMSTEVADAICTACYRVTQGPCAEAFAEHVGQDAADAFAEYVPMTDREAELLTREAELVDQYYALMDGADDVTYEYEGMTWDQEMLEGIQGAVLASRDREGYIEVYQGLQKVLNDQVGPIFTQLVSIRAEIAQIEGYDTYSDLAYEQVFGRDYTPDEAQVFCEQVKQFAPAYLNDLYYSNLWYEADNVMPIMDTGSLLDALGKFTSQLDPMFEAPWRMLCDHGLYDIDAGDGRTRGAYTITLNGYGSEFIYIDLAGGYHDFGNLSHEFGHFTNGYYEPSPNIIVSNGSYDLLEIHSTALEALCTSFYDRLYDRGADAARFATLASIFEAVIDGCIYDEFQRRIYEQPDMTLDQMNMLFAQISASYGQYEPTDRDYAWIYVSHTFESPLYYISYAASALGAIQIWDIAQQDLQAGVDAYKAVMDRGAYEDGYLTVLADCGMKTFLDEGAVEEICTPLLDYLDELNAS